MNAYELAKYIEDDIQIQEGIADMLRQQADRIAELEKELKHYKMAWNMAENELENQTKPLSDEEIDSIIYSVDWAYDPVLLARAIEERHGIK